MSRFTSARGAALAPLVAVAVVFAACAKEAPEKTVLQGPDLSVPEQTFDPGGLIDVAEFTDVDALDLEQLQGFFFRTPYGRGSFLETYQSNGVRAANAIQRAATKFRINPIVLLVRAQMEQGLVGEEFYPFPPKRVEYVFGCGCPGVGDCDPAYAGFDLQAECLAGALRRSLDEIAASGVTAGGWGPDRETSTLDGEKVTPKNAATAALYQYTPKVGLKESSNWLFWRIWLLYTEALSYSGPLASRGGTSWFGDACLEDANCVAPDSKCSQSSPGGLCTASCTGECPQQSGRRESFCADLRGQGYCLGVCDPNVTASCRSGYVCVGVTALGSPDKTAKVCLPK
ncbi:MAG: hypothetical protein U0169_03815 [Polyangiaceae bacterium]